MGLAARTNLLSNIRRIGIGLDPVRLALLLPLLLSLGGAFQLNTTTTTICCFCCFCREQGVYHLVYGMGSTTDTDSTGGGGTVCFRKCLHHVDLQRRCDGAWFDHLFLFLNTVVHYYRSTSHAAALIGAFSATKPEFDGTVEDCPRSGPGGRECRRARR